MDNVPHFYAADRKSWRTWLEKNHETENAVWLVFDKGPGRTMTWQDIVEEALCFGWIDSRPGKVSETQSKIYISKRKPKSVRSKINKQNVEKLISQGSMSPSGLRSIEVAKQNGSWNALDLSDNLIYPKELKSLFDTNSSAKTNFEKFPNGSKRNILQWIYDAKTEATRLKRVEQTIEAAKVNIRIR
jgi:uncharacterized protein YdeI (YjbR/CyaY-like superfamily)